MIATIINCITVLIGSLIGLVIKNHISKEFKHIVESAAGLTTLLIGISMGIATQSYVVLLFSIIIGGLIGYSLKIHDGIYNLGTYLERRTVNKGEGDTFAKGFLNASVLFCSGAMSILGPIQAGTVQDYEILLIKSFLDGSMAIVFAATYGIGVMFSIFVILVYQGFFTILGSLISPLIGESGINELSAIGGIMILMIAFNLLDIKKFKTANYLPSLILAPILIKVIPPAIDGFIKILS
jgi:uncharacterized membrane protein YqgA involved in biofilm formation